MHNLRIRILIKYKGYLSIPKIYKLLLIVYKLVLRAYITISSSN